MTTATAPRSDVYADVAATVIAAIESGTPPWRRPWRASVNGPRNIKGRHYRGINVLLLLARGFEAPYWLTFKQALELGGAVRKGEKGTRVVLWRRTERTVEGANGDTSTKKGMFATTFTVFNIEQVDGVKAPEGVPVPDFDPIAEAEAIIEGMPNRPAILHNGGDRAFYRPSTDTISLPHRSAFAEEEEYYSTTFHELAHSTGHKDRVGRVGIENIDHFGSGQYGREELVAEMTAAFLGAHAGISPAVIANSAAYLGNWVKAIKEDTKMVVWAAGKAQAAADYILNQAQQG